MVDGGVCFDPAGARTAAARAQRTGYDGLWIAEANHDPFLTSLVAAQNSTSMRVGTSIAIAFARSPMTLAQTADDLQRMSGGRFVLGLGSQIRPHIERRFSMPWSRPAARMHEYVRALRAIWAAWHQGERLDFRGEFYTHTLMTPFFNPGPNPYGPPPVLLAGVGERMTEVAGEVCDGFICHSFTTEKYLREVTLPALLRGREKAGKPIEGFEICGPSFIVTGTDEKQFEASAREVRKQLSFYASTPAYRGVLELHGWGDLQEELNRMSKLGLWDDMAALIPDDMLKTFAVVGSPDEIAPELLRRYGDIVTRINLPAAQDDQPARWDPLFAAVKARTDRLAQRKPEVDHVVGLRDAT